MSEKFPLGAKVIVTNGNYPGRSTKAEIIKVGRVNVYIERYGKQVPFDAETGVEKRGSNVGGHPDIIRTPQMVEDDNRRAIALSRLRDLGLAKSGYGALTYSTDTLEQVIAILEQDS